MTDENKNDKADEAEVIEAEAKMPLGRFMLREARKLFEKLGPVLIAAIAGGGGGFLGWQLQGRSQAKTDAVSAARDEVRLLDEFESYMRVKAAIALAGHPSVPVDPTAPVASTVPVTSTAPVAPVISSSLAIVASDHAMVAPVDEAARLALAAASARDQMQRLRVVIDEFSEKRGLDADASAHLEQRGEELVREWIETDRRQEQEQEQRLREHQEQEQREHQEQEQRWRQEQEQRERR